MNLTDVKTLLEKADNDEKFKQILIEKLSDLSEFNKVIEDLFKELLHTPTDDIDKPYFTEDEIKDVAESLKECDGAYLLVVKKSGDNQLEINSHFVGDTGYLIGALKSNLENNNELYKVVKKAIEPVVLKKIFGDGK